MQQQLLDLSQVHRHNIILLFLYQASIIFFTVSDETYFFFLMFLVHQNFQNFFEYIGAKTIQ